MTRPQVPGSADVLVIGAGLAAAATAHALADSPREVLLLERRAAPGGEASGRSASMIREDVADEALAGLLAEGARLHREGRLAPFRPTGSFLMGRGDEDLSRHVPIATGRGRFFPGDGVVDAQALLAGWLSGRALATGVEVLRLEPARDGVAVITDCGTIHARVVVNAAGAWAGQLGSLPLEPKKRHLFATEPCGADPSWPFVWDDAAGYYFRPHEGGLLLCPCDERVTRPGDNAVEASVAPMLRDKLSRHQPALARLPLRDEWAGQRTFAPDGRFVVGWDAALPGLFWLAGLAGHGVTASPALGRLAARMILAGPAAQTPAAARAFSPERLRG